MAGISRWERTKRRAKADEVLCGLARHIQWHNQTYRIFDKVAFAAFTDRTIELDLYIPKGYLSIVLGLCMPPIPATA
jgi:hypothetical protein